MVIGKTQRLLCKTEKEEIIFKCYALMNEVAQIEEYGPLWCDQDNMSGTTQYFLSSTIIFFRKFVKTGCDICFSFTADFCVM